MALRHLAPFAAAIVWSTATAATAAPVVHTLVRIYGISRLDANATLTIAAGALRSANVEPEWVECDGAAAAAHCDDPMAAGELAVRFVFAPLPHIYDGRMPLGDSLIDRQQHRGVLATIYWERVLWLAREGAVDAARLTGLAVAHEIAHLLMGNSRHASGGLMRAIWSREDLERNQAADWTFTAADAAAIRRQTSKGLSRQARAQTVVAPVE